MADPRTYLGAWDVVAGDPLAITVNITSGGTGVDLTAYGSSWASDLRQSVDVTTPVVFTIDSTGAATGTLVFSLTGTQTAAMTTSPGDHTDWTFDVQASGGAVTPQTPFRGEVTVSKPYTHA